MFLARAATAEPDEVARIASSVPLGNNPQVARALVAIAEHLPAASVAAVARQLAHWFGLPLTLSLVGIDALRLHGRLVAEGELAAANDLLTAVLQASIAAQAAGDEWHLERTLEAATSVPSEAKPRVSGLIQDVLTRQLDRLGEAARYSTIWLPRVDRPPRLGRDRPGRLASALYTTLIGAPTRNANGAVRALLASPHAVLNRVALAVMADHPENAGPLDEVLLLPDRWDSYETRYEFRKLVRARFAQASEGAQTALLEYAERADEVPKLLERLPNGAEYDVSEQKRRWRTRFLGAVWADVPSEWHGRLGPIVEGEPVIEWREAEARFVRSSPIAAEELAGKDAPELLALLKEWKPNEQSPWENRQGLAGEVAAALAKDRQRFLPDLAALVAEAPELASPLARHFGEAVEQDPSLTVVALLPFIRQALVTARAASSGESYRSDVERNVAWLIEKLGGRSRLAGVTPEMLEELADIAIALLGVADPYEAEEIANLDSGWDGPTLALNSARGAAIRAAVALARGLTEVEGGASFATKIHAALMGLTESDKNEVVAAALGTVFPHLVWLSPDHGAWWAQTLFGPATQLRFRGLAIDAYVSTWSYGSDLGPVVADSYETALSDLEGNATDRARASIGGHLLIADLTGLALARERRWSERWFTTASEEERSEAARLLADAVVHGDEAVRGRAVDLLRWRVSVADPGSRYNELSEASWAAGVPDRGGEILEHVIVPALERGNGRTSNEPGVIELIAREAATSPPLAMRALRLAVDGDEYLSIPHLAEGALRTALGALLTCGDGAVVADARRLVHDLGARGAAQFRDLLTGPSEADEGPAVSS